MYNIINVIIGWKTNLKKSMKENLFIFFLQYQVFHFFVMKFSDKTLRKNLIWLSLLFAIFCILLFKKDLMLLILQLPEFYQKKLNSCFNLLWMLFTIPFQIIFLQNIWKKNQLSYNIRVQIPRKILNFIL